MNNQTEEFTQEEYEQLKHLLSKTVKCTKGRDLTIDITDDKGVKQIQFVIKTYPQYHPYD